jgi:CDP-diacylglycerol pyrophosphatase
LLPPFLHRLRFSLRSAGFWANGNRTTDSFHVRVTQLSGNSKRQLESILAHSHSSWLHLCLNQIEVITHA